MKSVFSRFFTLLVLISYFNELVAVAYAGTDLWETSDYTVTVKRTHQRSSARRSSPEKEGLSLQVKKKSDNEKSTVVFETFVPKNHKAFTKKQHQHLREVYDPQKRSIGLNFSVPHLLSLVVLWDGSVLAEKGSLGTQSLTLKSSQTIALDHMNFGKLNVKAKSLLIGQDVCGEDLRIKLKKEAQPKNTTTALITEKGHLRVNHLHLLNGTLLNLGTITHEESTTLNLYGNPLFNFGQIKSKHCSTIYQGGYIHNKGDIESDLVRITAHSLENHGSVVGQTVRTIVHHNLVNTGEIISAHRGDLISFGRIYNEGTIQGDVLQSILSQGKTTNTGVIGAPKMQMHTKDIELSATSKICSENLTLKTETGSIDGTLCAQGPLHLEIAKKLYLRSDLNLESQSLTIMGEGTIENAIKKLEGPGSLHFSNFKGTFIHTGLIDFFGDVLGQCHQMINQGILKTKALFNLHIDNLVNNPGAHIEGAGRITLTQGQNSGVLGHQNVKVHIEDTFENGGTFVAEEVTFKDQEARVLNRGDFLAHAIKGRLGSLQNFGVIKTNWELQMRELMNAHLLQGQGSLIVDTLENRGVFGNKNLNLMINQEAANRGVLTLDTLGGEGRFYNHHHLMILGEDPLSIAEFLNQTDPDLSTKPLLQGEFLNWHQGIRRFENGEGAEIKGISLFIDLLKNALILNRGTITVDEFIYSNLVNEGDIVAGSMHKSSFVEGGYFKNGPYATITLDENFHFRGETFVNEGSIDGAKTYKSPRFQFLVETPKPILQKGRLTGTTVKFISPELLNSGLLKMAERAFFQLQTFTNTKTGRVKLGEVSSDTALPHMNNQGTMTLINPLDLIIETITNTGKFSVLGGKVDVVHTLENHPQASMILGGSADHHFKDIFNEGLIKFLVSVFLEGHTKFTKLGKVEAQGDCLIVLPDDQEMQSQALSTLPYTAASLYLYAQNFEQPADLFLDYPLILKSHTFSNSGRMQAPKVSIETDILKKIGEIAGDEICLRAEQLQRESDHTHVQRVKKWRQYLSTSVYGGTEYGGFSYSFINDAIPEYSNSYSLGDSSGNVRCMAASKNYTYWKRFGLEAPVEISKEEFESSSLKFEDQRFNPVEGKIKGRRVHLVMPQQLYLDSLEAFDLLMKLTQGGFTHEDSSLSVVHSLTLDMGESSFHLKEPLRLKGQFALTAGKVALEEDLEADEGIHLHAQGSMTHGTQEKKALLQTKGPVEIHAQQFTNAWGKIFGKNVSITSDDDLHIGTSFHPADAFYWAGHNKVSYRDILRSSSGATIGAEESLSLASLKGEILDLYGILWSRTLQLTSPKSIQQKGSTYTYAQQGATVKTPRFILQPDDTVSCMGNIFILQRNYLFDLKSLSHEQSTGPVFDVGGQRDDKAFIDLDVDQLDVIGSRIMTSGSLIHKSNRLNPQSLPTWVKLQSRSNTPPLPALMRAGEQFSLNSDLVQMSGNAKAWNIFIQAKNVVIENQDQQEAIIPHVSYTISLKDYLPNLRTRGLLQQAESPDAYSQTGIPFSSTGPRNRNNLLLLGSRPNKSEPIPYLMTESLAELAFKDILSSLGGVRSVFAKTLWEEFHGNAAQSGKEVMSFSDFQSQATSMIAYELVSIGEVFKEVLEGEKLKKALSPVLLLKDKDTDRRALESGSLEAKETLKVHTDENFSLKSGALEGDDVDVFSEGRVELDRLGHTTVSVYGDTTVTSYLPKAPPRIKGRKKATVLGRKEFRDTSSELYGGQEGLLVGSLEGPSTSTPFISTTTTTIHEEEEDGGFLGLFTSTRTKSTTIYSSTAHPSHHTSEGPYVNLGDPVVLRAAKINAGTTVTIHGKRDVLMPSAVDSYHSETHETEKGLLHGTSKRDEVHESKTHQVTEIRAGDSIEITSDEGVVGLGAAHLKGKHKVQIDTPEGAIIFKGVEESFLHSLQEFDSSLVWTSLTNSGSQSTHYKDVEIDAEEIVLNAGKGIDAEFREETLQANPSLIQVLRAKGVSPDSLKEDIKSWHETHEAMGPGLSALIAIGVSLVIPGIGTGVSGAMMTAGAKALTTQMIVGMVNNQGDPLKTLEEMASGNVLRNTVISVGTAGLGNQLGTTFKIPVHPKTVDFMDHLQSSLIETAAQIPVEGIFSRREFSDILKGSLRLGAANLAGSYGSSHIGDAFKLDKIDALTQKLAHGALGAVSAALMEGEPITGAIGAVVGEMVGDLYREGLEGQNNGHPESEDTQALIDRGVTIARFTAATLACFTGQDPDVAALTAGNAARYNALAVSEKTRDVLVSLDEIEEELKSLHFEESTIEEGERDQEEGARKIALEKKKLALFVHKAGEKLLEQYAKLADWGIEKLEKNPDAAKMIDVVLLSFATYQQLMMELPERLATGEAERTQKAQKELDRALKSGTEAIREHLKGAGYSKEEQVVYAHAVAGPLLLLKAAGAKGKKGTSTAPSKELLTSLKDFKKAHGALKTKASMGEYRHTGGHHVHAKKAFEGHINYDPKKGFSISNEYMKSLGIDHLKVTSTQRRLFGELAKSGKPNTLKEHTRIAVESLVSGGEGKLTYNQARNIVSKSLKSLKAANVKTPTTIPWNS
ncbi:DUF637 domain-containing protein [Candidatus Nucleicultrix amoebiphila]|nr:DUF637 domain-containing protein [Candidatus Nucleicultrix amoebiphila]